MAPNQIFGKCFLGSLATRVHPTLTETTEMVTVEENKHLGDVVLVMDNLPRNSWMLGRVTDVHRDRHGLVIVVTVQTKTSSFQRPVNKLSLLLEVVK
jgi:hypothetical protein